VPSQRRRRAKYDEHEQPRRGTRHEEDPGGPSLVGGQVRRARPRVGLRICDGPQLEEGVCDLEDAQGTKRNGKADHEPAVPDSLLLASRACGRFGPVASLEYREVVPGGGGILAPVREFALRVDVAPEDGNHEDTAEEEAKHDCTILIS